MLINDAGDVLLALRVAEDKAILPAVLMEPGQHGGTHNVHSKASLVLAVTGQRHGFQCLIIGLLVAQTLLLVFLGTIVEDGVLLVLAAVTAVEPHLHTGGAAVQNHLTQTLLCAFVHPRPVVVANQIGLVVFRNGITIVHQQNINAIGRKIASLAVNLRGINRHGTVLVEVVTIAILVQPAGMHHAAVLKVVFLVFHCLPAGQAFSVLAKQIASVTQINPAFGHQAAALVKIIGIAIDFVEALDRGSLGIQIVNALRLLQPPAHQGAVLRKIAPHTVQVIPARGKHAVLQEIAAESIHVLPALHRRAVFPEIVLHAVNILPAAAHHAIAAEIVAATANGLPTGDHGIALSEIVGTAVVLHPAGDWLALFIQIIIVAVLLHPATAIHVSRIVPYANQTS